MCGRYLAMSDDEYEELKRTVYEVSEKLTVSNVVRGEVFPTNEIPVVYSFRGRTVLSAAKWGFPNFKSNGVIINARAETLAEKPMFRSILATKRCIIPADGYYEWLSQEDKSKTKYLISVKDRSLFYMAGLYNIFIDKNGIAYAATTIITTNANPDIEFIHNRMPVILQDKLIDKWLDSGNTDLSLLQTMLIPYSAGGIIYEVA